MPTPVLTPSPPTQQDEFVSLLQAYHAPVENDGVRAFEAQGGVWPMGRPLQEPFFASFAPAPPSDLAQQAERDFATLFYEPWSDDLIYPGYEPHMEHSGLGNTDAETCYEADNEDNLLSGHLYWNGFADSAPALTRGGAPSPDPNPEAGYPAVVTWEDILGLPAHSFASLGTTGSPDFESDGEMDSDSDRGPPTVPEEGCSRRCAFFPWRKRWSIIHRLLQHELADPAPNPTIDTTFDAFDDLTNTLGLLNCPCADAVNDVMDEMIGLQIVLQASKRDIPNIANGNISNIANLLSNQLYLLDEGIREAANTVRYSHTDDSGSDTDRSIATFISSHSGSVYLDL
jgi:hypothetical protein